MKTASMQERLDRDCGKLESGQDYQTMPTDCRGDGYDIAVKSRADESGDYQLPDGRIARVTCAIKCGSRNWSKGLPLGYKIRVTSPNDPPKYILCSGERAAIVERIGRSIGNGYMHRALASIAIYRANGSKIYHGHTPYWLGSTATYAEHYRSGMSRADSAAYMAEVAQLQADVDQINAHIVDPRWLSGPAANFCAAC